MLQILLTRHICTYLKQPESVGSYAPFRNEVLTKNCPSISEHFLKAFWKEGIHVQCHSTFPSLPVNHVSSKGRLARSGYLDFHYSVPQTTIVWVYNQTLGEERMSDYPWLEELSMLLITGYVDTNLSADWLKGIWAQGILGASRSNEKRAITKSSAWTF